MFLSFVPCNVLSKKLLQLAYFSALVVPPGGSEAAAVIDLTAAPTARLQELRSELGRFGFSILQSGTVAVLLHGLVCVTTDPLEHLRPLHYLGSTEAGRIVPCAKAFPLSDVCDLVVFLPTRCDRGDGQSCCAG